MVLVTCRGRQSKDEAADLHAARTRWRAVDGWLYSFDLARKAIALLGKLHGRQGRVSDVSKVLAKLSVSDSACNQAHHLVAVVVHARNMALEARQWWPVVAQRHERSVERLSWQLTVFFFYGKQERGGEKG